MRPIAIACACLALAASCMHAEAAPTRAARARGAEAAKLREGPRGFTIEHALSLVSYSDLTWSADGRRLAFVVTSADTAASAIRYDLWMHDLERHETTRLTRLPAVDVSPTFSPSGDTIAFVSTRGDESKAAITMMSLRGGDPWVVGSFDEGIGEVKWSPDGRTLAFVMSDTLPTPLRERRRRKWDEVVEDQRLQYPRLWVLDLATGARRRLTSGETYVWNVRWSPDSRRLAFIVSPSGRPDDGNLTDVGVVARDGGPMRALGVIGAPFAWSPDGRWIACATAVDRDRYVEKTDLWIAPGGGGGPLCLSADFDGDVGTPMWSATSDTLFFHSAQGVTTRLAAVALPLAGDRPRVALLDDREAEAGAPVGAANGRAAWVESRPDAPDEIWIADHPRLHAGAVTSLNAAVASLALGSTRRVEWLSSDGVRVGGMLVRPPGAPEKTALPTLVWLHGGPYGERIGLGFQDQAQVLAARGYQVFLPNYRGSVGCGTAFLLRKRGDWAGQDWRDVTSGVDSLVRWGLADGNRLGIFGRSYGGYLSAWAIAHTGRFDAACITAGAVDLPALFGQSDAQRYRIFEFEGAPWEKPELWREASPITHIASARTPTLILFGENDRRVPIAQGQELYRALHTMGVPVELIRYPREGHGIVEPHHRADVLSRTLAWFDRWVR